MQRDNGRRDGTIRRSERENAKRRKRGKKVCKNVDAEMNKKWPKKNCDKKRKHPRDEDKHYCCRVKRGRGRGEKMKREKGFKTL